jgi:hypothetical protein
MARLIECYFGRDFDLGRLRNVLGFLVAAVAAAAASGVGGTAAHKLLHSPRRQSCRPGSIGLFPTPSALSPLHRW